MKNILMIEDDPGSLSAHSQTLQSEGYQVSVVSDGGAGWTAISQTAPDLILLDLHFGARSLDLIRQVRATSATQNLPIIVFANTFDKKSVAEACNLGVSNCLFKSSCTPRVMIAAVNKVMRELAHQAAVAPETAASSGHKAISADLELQASLRASFLKTALKTTGQLRTVLHALSKAETDAVRLEKTLEMHKNIWSLATNAGLAELPNLANMATALDAFLRDLHEQPKSVTSSALRTIATTIDFLTILVQNPDAASLNSTTAANIFSVDDDPVSQRDVTQALERVGLKAIALNDSEMALEILQWNNFDLVILDIEMPGMNGFELCKKLRQLPQYAKTPVIFVTTSGDFENRAKSTLAGGNDLIAKPFLAMELAVKALIYIQKGQMTK